MDNIFPNASDFIIFRRLGGLGAKYILYMRSGWLCSLRQNCFLFWWRIDHIFTKRFIILISSITKNRQLNRTSLRNFWNTVAWTEPRKRKKIDVISVSSFEQTCFDYFFREITSGRIQIVSMAILSRKFLNLIWFWTKGHFRFCHHRFCFDLIFFREIARGKIEKTRFHEIF